MHAAGDNHPRGDHDPPPPPSRAQLIEETRQKMAKLQAKKDLMVTRRKEKIRRHRRKKRAEEDSMSDEERERRRAQEAQATAWLEALYAAEEAAMAAGGPLPPRLRIALDLVYDSSASLYSSLARQLGCAYGLMRKATRPDLIPSLHLTHAQGEVMDVLVKKGAGKWAVHRHTPPVFEVFDRATLVYLTPDSPHLLGEVDPTKTYVVGGLVDRVVLKGKSYSRATSQGVATARLPLKEFFARVPGGQKHLSNVALAVDRVIEIVAKQYEYKDWDRTLGEVFPGALQPPRRGGEGEGSDDADADAEAADGQR